MALVVAVAAVVMVVAMVGEEAEGEGMVVVVGDMEVTEAMTGATIEAMEVTAATIEATTEAMVVVAAAAVAAATTEMDVAAADEVIDFTLSLLCAVFASGTQNFTSSASVIIAFCSVSSSLDAPR